MILVNLLGTMTNKRYLNNVLLIPAATIEFETTGICIMHGSQECGHDWRTRGMWEQGQWRYAMYLCILIAFHHRSISRLLYLSLSIEHAFALYLSLTWCVRKVRVLKSIWKHGHFITSFRLPISPLCSSSFWYRFINTKVPCFHACRPCQRSARANPRMV